MKKSYIITALLLGLSIITISVQAQNNDKIKEQILNQSSQYSSLTPTVKGMEAMEKNITATKERLMLLKSSGVKQEVLSELAQTISDKEQTLEMMKGQYDEMQESVASKYQKALMLKDKVNAESLDDLTIDQIAQELDIPQEDLNLENIEYLLNTQDLSTEETDKLEKLAISLKENQNMDLVTTQVNKRYKLKEAKELQDGVKELVIKDRLDIKDRMFWELDLGVTRNNMSLASISPLLGYQLSKRFSLGVGPTWQRIANADQSGEQMGSRVMARVNVVKDIFSLQVENITNLSSDLPEVNLGESAQLLGGRLNLPTIKGKQLNLTLLHNLSQQKDGIPAAMGAWQAKMGIMF